MKNIFYLIIALLLSASSIEAQTTEGREFWVTFGQNAFATTPATIDALDLRIRIVGGGAPTFVNIYFTNLGTYGLIDHEIEPYEVYDYVLEIPEKHAVYNTVLGGTTNRSIHITASNPVSVFASNWYATYGDATNILPVAALGTEYYQISYKSGGYGDAYAVIATEDNTHVYHDNEPVAILDAGDVYYKRTGFFSDMTSAHITATANKPVAFFAMNTAATVWGNGDGALFQQLASVNTWGKTFFVPVTMCGTEYVRILASEDNTIIKQTGGTIVTGTGGQSSLNLQAGQFVELEISLSNNGCFISADKPVGVCSFMRSHDLQINPIGQCSQVWIPAIEQTMPKVLMAPFVLTYINYHYALVVTPTATRDETKVSIGGGVPEDLTDGSWYAHTTADADMSFYNLPLTNLSAPYTFSNPAGIIVLGYGIHGGTYLMASYYYLAGSAMRNLEAAFYANDVYYAELQDQILCTSEVEFRAEIRGISPEEGNYSWSIDGIPETDIPNPLLWNGTFSPREQGYEIKLVVTSTGNEPPIEIELVGILNIGAAITAEPFPTEGGNVEGDGCFWENEMVNLVATPADGYKFMEWREKGIPISPAPPPTYSFPAEEDRTSLVAHFAPMFCGGTGTATDPYLICNAEQLDSIRYFLYDRFHFQLNNDIDLSAYLATGAGHDKWGASGWEPIGDADTPFTGSLNGDGYRITGLWINRTGDYVGLFGFIDGAVIKNVGLILKK